MTLHILDYAVLCCSFAMSGAIGIFFGCRPDQNKKTLDYLLANRKMNVLPVALSLGATVVSGSTMVGVVGEVYMYGGQYIFFAFGATMGLLIAAVAIIPVYKQIDYISIYEYVERRFHYSMRLTFSIVYIISRTMFLTVVLYIPAISLSTLTPVPQWASVLVSGVICVLYCVLGGMKAVIWTDVLQTLLMLISYGLIIVSGLVRIGGIETVWNRNIEGLRIGHPNYLEDQRTRYSIWSLTFNGMVILMNSMCGQAGIQRVLCVTGVKKAQNAVVFGAVMVFVFLALSVVSGFTIFANFAYCDPIAEKVIKSPDQIFLYAIGQFLGDIPGLQGLALAGIFSSSLSTFSSYLNSFSALIVEDFIQSKWSLSEKKKLTLCKLFTLVYGSICILLTFLVPLLGGIMKVCFFVLGSSGGPMTAVIFLGAFIKKANFKGSLIGLLSGVVFCMWIAIGGSLQKPNYRHLPLSTEGCTNYTLTARNETSQWEDPFILYTISFMWYGPIGFVITFIVGFLFSYMIGTHHTIDPRLLSPLIEQSHPQNGKQDLQLGASLILPEQRILETKV